MVRVRIVRGGEAGGRNCWRSTGQYKSSTLCSSGQNVTGRWVAAKGGVSVAGADPGLVHVHVCERVHVTTH